MNRDVILNSAEGSHLAWPKSAAHDGGSESHHHQEEITPVQLSRSSRTAATYFILGQAGWFACVFSAARGKSWLGVVFVAVLIVLHLTRAKRLLPELKLIASVALVGTVWESAILHFGLLAYPNAPLLFPIAPLWIIALWSLFAAQLNTSYRWLKPRLVAAALLGALAGPISFHAGSLLGAVHFVHAQAAYVALAIGWAVILPLITLLSRRWDGVA